MPLHITTGNHRKENIDRKHFPGEAYRVSVLSQSNRYKDVQSLFLASYELKGLSQHLLVMFLLEYRYNSPRG